MSENCMIATFAQPLGPRRIAGAFGALEIGNPMNELESAMSRLGENRGLVCVLGPEEGASHWQPEPASGYITLKVSPRNLNTHFAPAGFQVIDPGCHIRPHAHERAEELLFIWQGSGVAVIGLRRCGD
jgi:hypothetical protein